MDHNIKMILSRNTKCLNTIKMCVDSQQHCPSDRLWLFLWSFGALVFQVIEFSSFLFVCFLICLIVQHHAFSFSLNFLPSLKEVSVSKRT